MTAALSSLISRFSDWAFPPTKAPVPLPTFQSLIQSALAAATQNGGLPIPQPLLAIITQYVPTPVEKLRQAIISATASFFNPESAIPPQAPIPAYAIPKEAVDYFTVYSHTVREFNLSHLPLRWETIAPLIRGCPNLITINMQCCKLTLNLLADAEKNILFILTQLPALEHLDLSGNSIYYRPGITRARTGLPVLNDVDPELQGYNRAMVCLTPLAQLTKLKTLRLGGIFSENSGIPHAHVINFRSFKKVEELDISTNSAIWLARHAKCLSDMPALKTLILRGCTHVTPGFRRALRPGLAVVTEETLPPAATTVQDATAE